MYDTSTLYRQMLGAYLNDLREYHSGDVTRFDRMVGAGGEKFATATPHGWAQHAYNMLSHLSDADATPALAQLAAWGYGR